MISHIYRRMQRSHKEELLEILDEPMCFMFQCSESSFRIAQPVLLKVSDLKSNTSISLLLDKIFSKISQLSFCIKFSGEPHLVHLNSEAREQTMTETPQPRSKDPPPDF